ncbi:MAG: tyrosine--tRNA ligase [Bacteroidia bacterium]|nr:tyrosine--tRNA ligase [Bacteroidia bacterium]
MFNVIEELRWRGMIHDVFPGTEDYFSENCSAVYLGVDPTSDSMHIGNLVPVMMLVHMQRAGHTPYALVGGATGMVGDPSGKDKERNLLTLEQVEVNVAGIAAQLRHFLDFEAPNKPVMVNNYDWFKNFGFLEFLRDVGKHITIAYMMNKDSVKKRMESEAGISYTEFAYQLLQGYDFLHLYQHHNVQLQVGGSDQWGNITTGTELIRRVAGHEAQAFAAVCPLMTREDGSKFGKSADGSSVWLDAEKTSPYQFYQYWLNVGDNDAERLIKLFTLKDQAEIASLVAGHQEAPHLRSLHKALADDITLRVHGPSGLSDAHLLTDFFFGRIKSRESLQELSEKQWQEVARSSELLTLSRARLAEGIGILDLLAETGITSSKGEAKRAIEKDKSVKLNMESCDSSETMITANDAFIGKYLYLQRGKKNKFIIEVR